MNAAIMKNNAQLNVYADFPILQQHNRGKPIIYLDSASSAQKPQQVIEAITHFYSHDYANIHRGMYELSERSTTFYEETRTAVKNFIHANHTDEIVFTHGTTDAINLIAQSYGRSTFQAGDEVILSEMEHHSNIVPWYLLKEQMGIVIKVIPVTDAGALDMDAYQQLFSRRTKLVALTHASNVTGVGVLYGKQSLLEAMPPYQGGGGMIETVSFSKTTFASSPQKFEAGTPPIASVIGLQAALQYVNAIGIENIFSHDQFLLNNVEHRFADISGLRIIGLAKPKLGVISFVLDDVHPHDVSTVLDHEGIAIRAGHHCAMPLMERFRIPATARISFGVYNTQQDIDAVVNAIQLAKRLLT